MGGEYNKGGTTTAVVGSIKSGSEGISIKSGNDITLGLVAIWRRGNLLR